MSVVLIPRDPANARKRNVDPKPAWGKTPDGDVWIRCECGWHIMGKLEGWQP